MSQTTLDRITRMRSEIADISAGIETVLATADTETRSLTADELTGLDEARGQVETKTAELEQLTRFHNSVAGADALAPVHVPRAHTQPRGIDQRDTTDLIAIGSVGEQFIGCEELRGYRGGRSDTFTIDNIVPSAFALGQTRAALTTGTSPWDEVLAAGAANVVTVPGRDKQRPLLEVISRAPTTLASVPVLRVAPDESGAAIVAEGADKPEVTWTETFESVPVETIAGWRKASRQVLDDVALVRNLIDTKLTRSVLNALEAEIVTALTDAITPANTTTGDVDVDLLNVIRLAVGELEGRGYVANAVMLNPADYAGLDLSVLGSTMLGPVVGSQFWGLRVVSNPNIAAGTAYVGDFTEAITLFERTGMSLFVTDSDISGAGSQATSDFRRNIITILAEIRAVPVVVDASAIEAADLAGS